MVCLGERCGSHDNNFNLIRMLAAIAVLVSHAWPITLGYGTMQPLEAALGRHLGWNSVAVFFIISGFLIARSFDRRASIVDWTASRVLRIFPALVVSLAVTVLLLGSIATTLPLGAYFSDPDTSTYWPRNLALFPLQHTLPGVFEENPYANEVNGSLWSLRHEVTCYFGVLLLGLAGALGAKRRMIVALVVYGVFRVGVEAAEASGLQLPALLPPFVGLSLPFALGTAFYVWRDHIRLTWIGALALAGLTAVLRPTPLFLPALMLALAYWTFCIAYLPGGAIRRYNLIGDGSYGVYIYAFPVQQLVVWLLGPMTPALNILFALPATLMLAALSWHFVERPSLALKGYFRRRERSPGRVVH